MKVTSVERVGSWRPSYADARPVAVSRLQSIAPVESADGATSQAITSERELPPLPVKQMDRAMARPVLPSDKPQTTNAAADATGVDNNPVTTVLAFKAVVDQSATGTGVAEASRGGSTNTAVADAPESDAGTSRSTRSDQAPQRPTLAELQRAVENPGNLTALELATQASNQRAAEEARKAAAAPPAEPISKLLMDHVQSMWAASRKAVDAVAAMHSTAPVQVPKPTTGAPAVDASQTDATASGSYTISRQKKA